MLLIINLGIILTLLIIILFNIKNTKRQIIITLGVLSILIIFKLICDKMIKNNKSNDEVNNYLVDNDNMSNNSNNNMSNNVSELKDRTNKFDLKNLDHIVNEMKSISNSYNEEGEENIDSVNVNKNNYIFTKHSGNKDYHYKDLHNGIFWERKNVSGEKSLLLDNIDCSNDNSCIIQPTIYNFHKV